MIISKITYFYLKNKYNYKTMTSFTKIIILNNLYLFQLCITCYITNLLIISYIFIF